MEPVQQPVVDAIAQHDPALRPLVADIEQLVTRTFRYDPGSEEDRMVSRPMLIDAHQRLLEIRRHAERAKPGQHLSRAGIARSRIAGASGLPIARVVTSPSPRAVQTAVA